MRTPFPLGRVQQHDPRSLSYPAETGPLVSKTWRQYGQILDQGQVGSCTGNAAAAALNHNPLLVRGRRMLESDALRFYGVATVKDGFPGVYPPDDTGSSGLAVAQAVQSEGYITSYRHAFGLDHALNALMISPLLIGSPWLEDMFYPDSNGFVTATGTQAGGHEYLLRGVNMRDRIVKCQNSWSTQWGHGGYFFMTFDTLETLLNMGGDVTQFVK